MAYKYYKTDFQMLVTVNIVRQTSDGQQLPVTTDSDFNLRFYVDGRSDVVYTASHIGSELRNCTILNSSQVIVFFDRTQKQLSTGNLLLEAEFIIPDDNYEGDSECNIKRLYSTGVVLTDKPDLDDEGALASDIVVPGSLQVNSLASEADVNGIFV